MNKGKQIMRIQFWPKNVLNKWIYMFLKFTYITPTLAYF